MNGVLFVPPFFKKKIIQQLKIILIMFRLFAISQKSFNRKFCITKIFKLKIKSRNYLLNLSVLVKNQRIKKNFLVYQKTLQILDFFPQRIKYKKII